MKEKYNDIYKDYFGKNAIELRDKKLFLLDMDGTVYKDNMLFEGTLEFLYHITANGGKYVFITNNSSKSVTDYIEKVKHLGIKAEKENFFTSAQASILYMKQKYPDREIYCQGTKSLVDELCAAGLTVVTEVSDSAGLILVGFDTELTALKIQNTCRMLQRDIPYLATNPDLACPVSFGFIPDCGSICKMLENATGRKPFFVGKPEPAMVDAVRKRFGYKRSETVIIGDRLYTDIATGLNAKIASVCVLTGEATAEDILKSDIVPAYTFSSVKDIIPILGK